MYHYKECGLQNVWLENGYFIQKTKHGKAVSFHDVEGLHQARKGLYGQHFADSGKRKDATVCVSNYRT